MDVRKQSRRLTLAAALVATGAAGLAAVPTASARQIPLRVGPAGITHIGLKGPAPSSGATLPDGTDYSTNWSGYANDTGTYSTVTTSWTQPAVNCSVTPNSYAAFWAGLDGFSSSTVEQDGTLAQCVRSGRRSQVAVYLAWYEAYPAPMYQFGGSVVPGDALTATVTYSGSNSFALLESDVAGGRLKWSASKSVIVQGAARSSAEVIAEAPSSNSGVLPLADFGTMNFSSSSLTSGAVPIEMITQGGKPEAIPGSLNGSGGFSVTWQ